MTVFVVDDDASVRRSLARLLRSAGYEVETFNSATEFLGNERHRQGLGCVVLDVRMPGLTGLDLQARLTELNSTLAMIFISGHGDIPMSVQAMKGGAVDFLSKPFNDEDLLEAVAHAIEKSVRSQKEREQRESIQRRLEMLTPREREVMTLVVAGRLNKQAAAELGTVEKTIKVHRARVMAKMQVQSLADLVRLAERAGVSDSEQ